jgi:lambda repressor-like predicted transcriptional regulator
LDEERHAFQRETLLELQDALQRQVRCATKVILHDRRTLQEHGTLKQLGPGLNAESYEIGVTTRRLKERVLDDALRNAVEEFRSHVAVIETSSVSLREMSAEAGVQHLDDLQRDLGRRYIILSDLVGTALRSELGWLPEETRPE